MFVCMLKASRLLTNENGVFLIFYESSVLYLKWLRVIVRASVTQSQQLAVVQTIDKQEE